MLSVLVARPTSSKLAVALAATVVAAVLAAAPMPAQAAPDDDPTGVDPTDDFAETDCPDPLPEEVVVGEDVVCGMVTVPLDHGDPDGGQIEVAVAVASATGEATDDPVLVLGGGPGESLLVALAAFVGPRSVLAPVNDNRDVVLIDQRGVGFSDPNLDCPEAMTALEQVTDPDELPAAFAQGAQECRDRLAAAGIGGDALSAFNTQNNAADLDAVRAALGYGSMHLFGTSYGARLALQAARAFPDAWTSQTLSSPVPAEANWVEDVAPSFDAALAGLFAACEDDPDCGFAHRDSAETLRRVIERLREEPGSVEVTDPETGETVTVPVHALDVASTLFTTFYLTPLLGQVPAMIDAFDAGRYDFGPAVSVMRERTAPVLDQRRLGQPDIFDRLNRPQRRRDVVLQQDAAQPLPISQGMQLSFLCGEELAYADRQQVGESAAGASPAAEELMTYNPVYGLPAFELCDEMWEVDRADPLTFEPVETDLPSLVVTGELDQITAPDYGPQVLEGMTDGHLVEVPQAGHSPLLGIESCGVAILAEFLDDPAAAPDTTCADEHALDFLAAPVAAARGIDNACPPDAVAPPGFVDVSDSDTHAGAIGCIGWWEVTQGVDAERYAPLRPVTRGQMATFVASQIERSGGQLPSDPPDDRFPDVGGSVHEPAINQLAELGIVQGFTDGRFGPNEEVNRGQMATFIVRGLEHRRGEQLRPGPRVFPDGGDIFGAHAESIDKASAAKVVAGRSDGSYGAPSPVPRSQMASFLGRGLDLLVFEGVAGPPPGR